MIGQRLGTDDLGRDLLSRVARGAAVSLPVGAAATLLALGIGLPLGLLLSVLCAAFTGVALFIGSMGAATIAGHQAALNFASLVFMLPAGLSAAIRIKQLAAEKEADISVCVLEKGSEVGAHILSGAVIDPRTLDEFLPERHPARSRRFRSLLGSMPISRSSSGVFSEPFSAPAIREIVSSISVPPRSFAPACNIRCVPVIPSFTHDV